MDSKEVESLERELFSCCYREHKSSCADWSFFASGFIAWDKVTSSPNMPFWCDEYPTLCRIRQNWFQKQIKWPYREMLDIVCFSLVNPNSFAAKLDSNEAVQSRSPMTSDHLVLCPALDQVTEYIVPYIVHLHFPLFLLIMVICLSWFCCLAVHLQSHTRIEWHFLRIWLQFKAFELDQPNGPTSGYVEWVVDGSPICPDPGNQWGSGISRRLIPLERTSTILNSYLACHSPAVFTGCHEWLLRGYMRSSLLTLKLCFLRCFVSILSLWSMPIPVSTLLDALLMMSEHCCYFCQRRSIMQGHCLIDRTSLIIHWYFVDPK